MIKKRRYCITILLFLFLSPVYSQNEIINYYLTITDADQHLAEIELHHPHTPNNEIEFSLPAWRTGRYEILNLANGISSFKALDKQGNELHWRKVNKNAWRIYNPSKQAFTLRYTVYANQLSTRSRHIDDTHAFINASGYFLYTNVSRSWPLKVQLNLPTLWESVTGLPAVKNQSHQYLAINYDQLVDSPIEAGIIERHTFIVENTPYELAIWGKGNYDSQQMVADLSKLVATYRRIWPNKPYSKYVFMVHATTDTRGATEHLNSTIIQRKRFTFAPRKQYLEFLATAAHEFIHTWNVKSYRPAEFVPYDYLKEKYSPLLWISEGSTRYFQYHLLIAAGLMTPSEYLQILANEMFEHHATPGTQKQSLADASLDKWIAVKGHQALNHSVNIYDEGALLSFILDMKLLSQSLGKISYRDVHAELYKRFATTIAFNTQDVLTILKDLTGEDYSDWWRSHVEKPIDLIFEPALNTIGLTLEKSIKYKQSGINFQIKQNLNQVRQVKEASPAWKAGITAGDIIIAINDLRLYPHTFDQRLDDYQPNQEIQLTLFRRDELITRRLVVPNETTSEYKIVPLINPSASQRKLYQAWLGVEYDF
ncbi:M61 family metallopeptidase [Algibacillus agarilyticus]|uniref:M61 family metallopeptidase n=1 Tax=Algibacillus agarilyticus TaxID=2234133 RepID=UPI000DD0D813|nr:PDZ domain-containing protein [Algibacillus agarilyticus]